MRCSGSLLGTCSGCRYNIARTSAFAGHGMCFAIGDASVRRADRAVRRSDPAAGASRAGLGFLPGNATASTSCRPDLVSGAPARRPLRMVWRLSPRRPACERSTVVASGEPTRDWRADGSSSGSGRIHCRRRPCGVSDRCRPGRRQPTTDRSSISGRSAIGAGSAAPPAGSWDRLGVTPIVAEIGDFGGSGLPACRVCTSNIRSNHRRRAEPAPARRRMHQAGAPPPSTSRPTSPGARLSSTWRSCHWRSDGRWPIDTTVVAGRRCFSSP